METIDYVVQTIKPVIILLLVGLILGFIRIASFQFNYNYDEKTKNEFNHEKKYMKDYFPKWLFKSFYNDVLMNYFPLQANVHKNDREHRSIYVIIVKYIFVLLSLFFIIILLFYRNMSGFTDAFGPLYPIIMMTISFFMIKFALALFFFMYEYLYLKIKTIINVFKLSHDGSVQITETEYIKWNEESKMQVEYVPVIIKVWFTPFLTSDKVKETYEATRIQYVNMVNSGITTAFTVLRDLFEFFSIHQKGLMAMVYFSLFIISISNGFYYADYSLPMIQSSNDTSTVLWSILIRVIFVTCLAFIILMTYMFILWGTHTSFHIIINKFLKKYLLEYKSEKFEHEFIKSDDHPDGIPIKVHDFSNSRQFTQLFVYFLKGKYIPHITQENHELVPNEEKSKINDHKILDPLIVDEILRVDFKKHFKDIFISKISLYIGLMFVLAFLITSTFMTWYESNPHRYQGKKTISEDEIVDDVLLDSEEITQRARRYANLVETLITFFAFILLGMISYAYYKGTDIIDIRTQIIYLIIIAFIFRIIVFFLFY